MKPSIRVMPWYFLIQISKSAIKAKRTLPGGIIIPDTDESGQHSLCYGTIVQIGKNAKGEDHANRLFPEAQVGDTAILHHWVETEQPLHEDEEFIYVITNDDNHNIKGIEKPDGTIIAHPSNVFCFLPERLKHASRPPILNAIEEPENWSLSAGGLFLFEGTFETDNNVRERIEEIELHSRHIAEGIESDTGKTRVAGYQKEGEKLTKQLNDRVVHELVLVFVHPDTLNRFEGLHQHDHVFALGWMENKGYALNYKGIEFILIKTDDVLFGLKKALVGKIKVA